MSFKLSDLPKKVIFDASCIIDRKRDIIKWTPVLNDILGGGLQSGSFVILTGNFKTGKTAAALHFGGHAQEAGYKVCFVNAEHRLSKRDLESSILDLDKDKFEVISSSEKGILTAEDFIATVESKIRNEENRVFIFDSLSQLCAEDLMTADIRDRYRDSTPLLLSRFCKRIAAPISINNHIFIGIVHIIANQGPGMAQSIEASGRKIQYAADFKIKALFHRPWEEFEERVGQEIHWQCMYSALGPPDRQGVGYLRYNHGFDETYEIMKMALDNQVLQLSGSWVTFQDNKIQGKDNVYQELIKQPQMIDQLRQELSVRLGNEI